MSGGRAVTQQDLEHIFKYDPNCADKSVCPYSIGDTQNVVSDGRAVTQQNLLETSTSSRMLPMGADKSAFPYSVGDACRVAGQ